MTEGEPKSFTEYDRHLQALPRLVQSYLRLGEVLQDPKLNYMMQANISETRLLILNHMTDDMKHDMATFISWRDRPRLDRGKRRKK